MTRYLSNIARRMAAVSLAALVLFTTTGFQLNAHYCAGSLKSFSFFGEAEACKHEMKKIIKKPCHMHGEMMALEKSEDDCCDYQDIMLEPAAYEAVALAKVAFDQSFEFVPQTTSVEIPAHASDAQLDFITTYRPPPIDRDIFVMVQSFLL
ncbi:hypothetical protein C900_05747 [Fulvivirga imtechensis AK7]|uniref:Secreted protein n=1 Tax=Fulvivirga imtechensis AK7 TaxID=1237149 RepID=L8K0X5_9BACT|nr:hypothetical protein [Fulvivirga imtechensis]ELR73112.1 hypothetical protein C900_05747 [Fulvivirga imtechensis AK7]